MYNYNFLCTYNLITDDKDLSDLCYKVQFLEAFNLKDFDNKIIENICNGLYNELKHLNGIKNTIENIKSIQNDQRKKVGLVNNNLTDSDIFCFLFSYDYFHKFHNEYCKFKNNKEFNFNNII